jgi:hypothetical protein
MHLADFTDQHMPMTVASWAVICCIASACTVVLAAAL